VNILQIATVDNGGGTYFLRDALIRWTPHKCKAIRTYQSRYEYPADVIGTEYLPELYDWADVIHLHDEAGALIQRFAPKPTVITYHGTRFREHGDQFMARCERRGWLPTVSTLDLTSWGAEWLPTPRRDLNRFWHPAKKFVVIHAPTNRERKLTDQVLEALQGFHLTLVENQTYAKCLGKKANAHVLVDGWHYGYGNNSIEAWAFGMPSIAAALPSVRDRMLEEWGYLPFTETDVVGLPYVIERMMRSKEFYAQEQEQGREHFMTYHHAPKVAERLVGFYERVLDADTS
jgi:glycosyltransferase involved in cell wall biosynthesis